MNHAHTDVAPRRMRGTIMLLLVASMAIAFGAVTERTEAIPPGGPSNSNPSARATLSPARVTPGGFLKVTGTKFPRNTTVTVKLDDSHILTTFRTNRKGTFTGRVKVPARTKHGAHWLRLLAPSPNTSVRKNFTVVRPSR